MKIKNLKYNKMKKFMKMLIALLLLSISTQAQIKPSQMSTATVEAFKEKLGLNNAVNLRDSVYVKSQTDALLNAKAALSSPALTGTPTAPTASAGTNTTQIATTAYAINAASNASFKDLQTMGMPGVAIPLGWGGVVSSTETMTSQDVRGITFTVRDNNLTVSGYYFVCAVAGVYTASNTNGICIYSRSGSTYTKVSGSELTDANFWTTVNLNTKTLGTPIVLTPGDYKICWVFSSSATTTAPQLLNMGSQSNTATLNKLFSATNWITFKVTGQTTLPATLAAGSMSVQPNVPAIWLF